VSLPTPAPGGSSSLLARGVLAAASPILLGLYAWFPFLGFLPYVALVPWILLYTDDRRPPVSAIWYVVGAWVAWMLQHPSVAHFGWFVPPVMAAALCVGWLPFPFVMRPIHRRFGWPRALTVPIVWVALEWLRSTITLAHFDLYALAYSQARVTPLVQIADVTGAAGVSFLVAAFNGWVADVIVHRRSRGAVGAAAPRGPSVLVSGAVLAAMFVAALVYGFVRLSHGANEPGPRIALVQPDVAHNERNAIGVHLSEVIFTDERVPAGSADLIVWPENAILDNLRRPGMYLPDLARLANEKGAPLLVGAMGKASEAPGKMTNAAYLVDRNGEILGEARKQVLFPWSEMVPGDAWLKRAFPRLWRAQRALVRKGWGFVPTGLPGRETVVLGLPWNGVTLPFGVLICVENAYAPIPAEAARKGARFLLNITSEREVGGPVQEQLLRISMMRAVENRIAYVRCGNSGISGFIDPQGRLRRVLRGENGGTIRDHGVLTERVLLGRPGTTLYARSHEAFAYLCVAATLALAAIAVAGRPGMARGVAVLAAAAVVTSGCVGRPRIGTDAAGSTAALARGRAELQDGAADRAIGPLARACAEASTCREAVPLLSEAFLATRRFEDAADLFSEIATKRPEVRGAALAERGRFLDRQGEVLAAEAAYAEAAALEPTASSWASLGTLRMRLDRQDGALDAYARALALQPDDPQMRYLHARALWLVGRGTDAEGEIDALLAIQPDHGAAWAVKGRLRDAAGDPPGAAEAYHHALRGDPENVEARFMLARRALVAKDFAQAEQWLREIWAIDTQAAPGRRGGGEVPR
jgi:apolipoprotein N-acyltransferase